MLGLRQDQGIVGAPPVGNGTLNLKPRLLRKGAQKRHQGIMDQGCGMNASGRSLGLRGLGVRGLAFRHLGHVGFKV